MKNTLIDIGGGTSVNINHVDFIIEASSDKARRMLQKYGYDRSSKQVTDATSNKETKSLIILQNDKIALSHMSANILMKRANKASSSHSEK